jgi:amidophosphoribosyltransferase
MAEFFLDKFHEECGIFGVFGHNEASTLTQLGLFALQHRGQEACGIVSSDSTELHQFRAKGLVADVLVEDVLKSLTGNSAIGHTRYSTSGKNTIKEVQPFSVTCQHGQIAVCHNGNLPFAKEKRIELEKKGAIFSSTSDTETILHSIARSQANNIIDAIKEVLRETEGAFSLLFLTENSLIAVRDPRGFRPLVLGKLKDAWCVASETCAFDLMDAETVREIKAGEMLVIDENGLHSHFPFEPKNLSVCTFEHVYFSRPDSIIFGKSVNESRHKMGKQLAIEQPCEADLVVPVPDSGVAAAVGYARQSGINFRHAIIRNHYVVRTFHEKLCKWFVKQVRKKFICEFLVRRRFHLVIMELIHREKLNLSRHKCRLKKFANISRQTVWVIYRSKECSKQSVLKQIRVAPLVGMENIRLKL